MSSLKIVDVNETAEQLPPEETQTEQAQEIQEEIKNEPTIEKQSEPTQQPTPPEDPKPVEKFKPVKDKMTTCQKCGKYTLLKSYRYKHEKTCQGSIEGRPIRAKAKPKPKPQTQATSETRVREATSETRVPVFEDDDDYDKENIPPTKLSAPFKNQILKPQPVNPLVNIQNHYQLLHQEYIKQKQEKYNNLCQNMFKSKPKKR